MRVRVREICSYEYLLWFSAVIHQISAKRQNVTTICGKWKDIISYKSVRSCSSDSAFTWKVNSVSWAHGDESVDACERSYTTLIEWPTRSVPTQANYSCNSRIGVRHRLSTYCWPTIFLVFYKIDSGSQFVLRTPANTAVSLRSFLKLLSFVIKGSGT